MQPTNLDPQMKSLFGEYWGIMDRPTEVPIKGTFKVPTTVEVPVSKWLYGVTGEFSALWSPKRNRGCLTGHLCLAAGVPLEALSQAATLSVLRSRGITIETPIAAPIELREANCWYLIYHANDTPELTEDGRLAMGPNRRRFVLESLCKRFLGVTIRFTEE